MVTGYCAARARELSRVKPKPGRSSSTGRPACARAMASRLFKAKKYVASKMSETASGRAVITQFIGPAGDKIFQSLRAATEHYAGAKRAKAMKVDIFKLVTKSALLYKNKVLAFLLSLAVTISVMYALLKDQAAKYNAEILQKTDEVD